MHIDLNADIGEGGDFDLALLEIVSSANISCGAHAGNLETITTAIRQAAANGVAPGAHPSYPDRPNFGRRALRLSAQELRQTITAQLRFLQQLTQAEGLPLVHVKPHGALYHAAATDAETANTLVRIFADFNPDLIITGLAGSQLLRAADHLGLTTKPEAFIDRRYQPDGQLLPRNHPRAVIESEEQALAQTLKLVEHGEAEAFNGAKVAVQATSLCVHGDTPRAIDFVSRIHHEFGLRGIAIQAPSQARQVLQTRPR
ncbi:MAG: 5-oxoprolinase subunit PxpA [Pseudomonadales bacterium]|nr:5-oxoprolinase subunit PxpA [Pseudomonadales bacterium]